MLKDRGEPMNYELYKTDNIEWMRKFRNQVGLIYADCIYESLDLEWVLLAWGLLKKNGVFIVQTDHHSLAEYIMLFKYDLKSSSIFVNHAIYKQEWGGVSKRYFPRKHDDILVYAKGKDYKFYHDRVRVPKKTAGTALDKKGTGLKIPCDVFDDLGNFHTMSKERIKGKDGKNIRWQKPLKLMDRLLLPFTDEDDWILDPFMGSASTAVWAMRNNRNFIGLENNPEIFEIAKERIENEKLQSS